MLRWVLFSAGLAAMLAAPASAADPLPKDKPAAAFEVPYRLTDTKHVLVRAKLNGQGPFNFILDTGAPAVFIPNKVAKKIGLKLDEKGWGEFDKFVLEGGLVVEKARTRVEDLFQLEGMNGMGLAGVELHGVIGYNVLAQFKITYDFTQDKLQFAHLKGFEPPVVKAIGKGGPGGGLDMMGTMMKMLAGMMGVKPNFEIVPTGFLGVEYEEKKDGLYAKSVLKESPADTAGILAGDKIESIKNASIDDASDFRKAISKVTTGDAVKVTVTRGKESKTLTVTLGKGL
jgi:hypothetical protein